MQTPLWLVVARKVRNVAPGIVLPAAQSVAWNAVLTFNDISIVDLDDNPQVFTAQVSHGVLTLSGIAGLSGSGNGTASLSYTGSLSAINAALSGSTYTPDSTYAGSDTLEIATSDGISGVSDSLAINVVRPAGLTYLKMTTANLFQTSAGGTAAIVGDPCGRVTNGGSSGVGNALQASSGLRPTVSSDVPSVFTDPSEVSLQFDGTDDALQIADNAALSGMGSLTVVAWAKSTATSSGLCRVYDKSFSAAYQIVLGGATSFSGGVNGTNSAACSVTSVLDWNHLICQYNGSNITMYGNGVAGTPVSKTGTIVTTAGDLFIGNRNGGGRTWTGWLKDIWVYSGVLSATQRAYLLAGGV